MSREGNGLCNTKGMGIDRGKYDVPADHQGRSLLTGSSDIDFHGDNRFTCTELEVFALE